MDASIPENNLEHEIPKFFEISLEMLCIAGTDGYFKLLNPAWEKVLGFTREELMASPVTSFIHPDDIESTLAEVWKVADGVPTIHFENRYRRKEGGYRWLAWNGTPDPQTGLLYGVARDITEQKEAQAKVKQQKEQLAKYAKDLERSNESLENFAYIVSHDLKAPLRAIHNLATWIEEDLGDTVDEEASEKFGLLKSRALRMNDLISGILNYSRVGRTKMTIGTVNTRDMLEEVIDTLSPPAGFEISIPTDLPEIQGEETRLQQVFQNLIGNAIKHHHRAEGRVEVAYTTKEKSHLFSISDDGPGIAAESQEHIFEIFMTSDRKSSGSSGIGLALVKKIIEEFGGEIWIESEVGKGAKFFFTLPMEPESY